MKLKIFLATISITASLHACSSDQTNISSSKKTVTFKIEELHPDKFDRTSVIATFDEFYYETDHEEPVADDEAAVLRTLDAEAREEKAKHYRHASTQKAK